VDDPQTVDKQTVVRMWTVRVIDLDPGGRQVRLRRGQGEDRFCSLAGLSEMIDKSRPTKHDGHDGEASGT
jgi:hypothetical protein